MNYLKNLIKSIWCSHHYIIKKDHCGDDSMCKRVFNSFGMYTKDLQCIKCNKLKGSN